MRVLVDTSVWIQHLKGKSKALQKMLFEEDTEVLTHSMVMAELMLGGIKKESPFFDSLTTQAQAVEVSNKELLEFIAVHEIHNRGVGYVDCSLLASCLLSDAALFTFDRKLALLAESLGIGLIQQ